MNVTEWPEGNGPRILKLVANDITIDGRVRKTASSLARLGFRVVVLGIDQKGLASQTEDLDGALLARVRPPNDPRVSTRLIRLSRAELRDSFQYRTELLRQRLQATRRNLTSAKYLMKKGGNLNKRVPAINTRLPMSIALGLRRIRAVSLQRRFQLNSAILRFLSHRPKRSFIKGAWRRDLPELHRFEVALGSVIDNLKPDLIHSHDVILLGVAARAKARAAAAGRNLVVIYDAHEYVPGLPIDDRRRGAYTDLESEYIRDVDRVVTVSPGLAQLFEDRFGIDAGIVLNAPDPETAMEATPLRSVANLSDDTRIVTYVGGIAPHRGAENLVNCVPLLPEGTCLVFVTASRSAYVESLLHLADSIGCGDRVRLVPYVDPDAVVSYIESADVSVIPLSREVMNYEVALPNKLFQSILARVPVAVSDNPEMARFVNEHGIGEVFDGDSVPAMANAISKILENQSAYKTALSDPELVKLSSWPAQIKTLISVYHEAGVTI